MGYEFHITRALHWTESESTPISADEWLKLVELDTELTIDPDNGLCFAVWHGPCRYPDGTWFDWSAGQIETKNPDRAILAKMLRIAAQLGAHVQGDDGEVYRTEADFDRSVADR